jgi:pimeloyl-ACP methyl ester carboxylesterase
MSSTTGGLPSRPLFERLARKRKLVRYDERGCGLSDWNVADFTLDAWVSDLETVVDAAGLERFPLLGSRRGGPIAIAYAIRHPERVSRLILYGSYGSGYNKRKLSAAQLEEWQSSSIWSSRLGARHAGIPPGFGRCFSGWSAEYLRAFDQLQRESASPENAARMMAAFGDLDVRDVAALLKVPRWCCTGATTSASPSRKDAGSPR